MNSPARQLAFREEDAARWSDIVCQHYVTVDCIRDDDTPLDVTMTKIQAKSAALSSVTSSAMTYRRSISQIRRDMREDLQITLVQRGRMMVEQNGRMAEIGEGQTVFYHSGAPYELVVPSGTRSVTLKVPTARAAARLPFVRDLTAKSFATTGGQAVFRSVLESMIDASPMVDEKTMELMLSPVLDMLALAVKDEVPDQMLVAGNGRSRELLRVQQWMLDHLGDSEMDIAAIAQANNVTPRTLNRLFAAEGTTAMRWLNKRRLDWAYRALAEKSVRSVTEACYSTGFNEITHFGRSFKQAFGTQPSEVFRGQSSSG